MAQKDHSSLGLTDSAGFWLSLFCGFGLIMMLVMGQRIEKRLFENAQAGEFRLQQSGPVDVAGSENGHATQQVSSQTYLRILMGIMSFGLVAGLILLVRDVKNFRRRAINDHQRE